MIVSLSIVSLSQFRWLDRNEDDGQIVRELVPFADGQRLFSKFLLVFLYIVCS